MSQKELEPKGVKFSSRETLKVTLLASEWTSSAGGLSTLNRELAIHLSQHPKVEVSFLVPEGACKALDKMEAQSYGITVVEAKERPGYEPLDWLSFPPRDLRVDVVVGHGVILGRQGQVIRDSARIHNKNCKWIQMVHTAPEELSRYKSYSDPISKGESKHEVEVRLCKLADLVVPVGPELKEAYSAYLRRCKKDQDVFAITPGLFDREFGELQQYPNESGKFKVLLCGRGDDEDFELKGYNIAAKAFTDHRLKRKPYHLLFVGAHKGKQDEIREKFLHCGIAEEQLTVRQFVKSRERLKDLMCEVDLAIMPSRSEGFGLISLEALSAGLPILVGSKSGFARAIENIPHGKSCIVDLDDPTEWAKAIEAARAVHTKRLEEIKALRESYEEKYSWKQQCEALVEKMWRMVFGFSDDKVPKVESRVKRPPVVETSSCTAYRFSLQQRPLVDKESEASLTKGDVSLSSKTFSQISSKPSNSGSLSDAGTRGITVQLKITAQDLTNQQQGVFDDLMQKMVLAIEPDDNVTAQGVGALIKYLKRSHSLLLNEFLNSGLETIVQCPTLESLDSLLNDYYSGHLNEVAERCLVTEEVETKLNKETLRLRTVINAENHLGMFAAANTGFPYKQPGEDQETRARWTYKGAASSGGSPSWQTEPDQGASAVWADTSSKIEKASRSALHKASINGQYHIVKMLLDIGEDVDKRDQFSLTPLHLACWYGQASVVRLLLAHGANVNAVDKFQRTPLQKAERQNHQSIVQILRNSGANPSYEQPPSLKSLSRNAFLHVDRRSGFNLLQAAVFEGNYNIVHTACVLFDNFIKAMNFERTREDAKVLPGKSAVDILMSLEKKTPGHADIINLYQKGVKLVNTLTELHCCARTDDAEKAVELVVNDGVDPNIPALYNRTPLSVTSPSSSRIVETLLDLGADANTQRSKDKIVPLMASAYWNRYTATVLLLEHGAVVNMQNLSDNTPLHFTAFQNACSTSKLLIGAGCNNINSRNIAGKTPLHIAVQKNHENLVKLFFENNVDVNIQDDSGDTPLHLSVRVGNFHVSQLLIEAGCNINTRNKSHKTPLYVAVEETHEQLITLLLSCNADVCMRYKQDPKERFFLFRGKDSGRPVWQYVLVHKPLLGLYLKQPKGASLDVADFGTVLQSGWGENPPEKTRNKILERETATFQGIPDETLLHVASRNNNTKVIDLLVDFGVCGVNSTDGEGFTPLHMAAIHGNMNVVRQLVDLKADINLITADGKDAIELARLNEETEIEAFLESRPLQTPAVSVMKLCAPFWIP